MTAIMNVHDMRQFVDSEKGQDEEVSEDWPLQRPSGVYHKSASYTCVPNLVKNPAYNNPRVAPFAIKGSFSEDDLIAPLDDSADVTPADSPGWITPNDEARMPVDSAQDLMAELHRRYSKITITRPPLNQRNLSKDSRDDESSNTNDNSAGSSIKDAASLDSAKAFTVSSSERVQRPTLATRLSRKLSYSAGPSRSPSPTKRSGHLLPPGYEAAPSPPAVGSNSIDRRKSIMRRRDSEKETGENRSASMGGLLSRRGTLLRRKSTKSPKDLDHSATEVRASVDVSHHVPAMPSLPKSFSTDKLPSISQIYLQQARPALVPRTSSGDRLQQLSSMHASPRKRDELWNIFRSLDGDYTKFQSRSSSLKADVVRTSLLPFLRNYADHPSNHTLRAEDLDRRANILNKWWTALLEMLHGRNNQSISGTDRPAILDGISGIMERPEWRTAPSPLSPIHRRNAGTTGSSTTSPSSSPGNGNDFLVESVHHNVRNMFIQNLNAQMIFVADKMSLRNASASLVTFCGKATAYAFFFCPGIAEVLVRLWDTPMETMRRVLDENGVGKFESLNNTSPQIVSAFPPHIQQLGFVSLGKILKHLRSRTPLPPGTLNIQWCGHWLERWLGRESDLFYTFVKNFHMLVTDYLPLETTKKERMCAPGMLLVHAQILANLDSTIHRDGNHGHGEVAISANLGDVLADPDAVASTLPLPPTNAIRIMAENRLVMLIRDFLSERAHDHPQARQLFAESFNDLLQACAKGTSIYDHAACYTLLDFLEEALIILVRFEHITSSSGTLINSSFWQDVCKKMMTSQNTMTEIRLFAFLYTIWSTVSVDIGRKGDLCLGLLLDEVIFVRTFNHWCPMVRAYYMRLLCWRLGRYDGEGEASPIDRQIMETLLHRLRSVWSTYLWSKEEAEDSHILAPSIAPCNPAPGRRLLIMRTDTQVAPEGSFLAFDVLSSPHSSAPFNNPNLAYKKGLPMSPVLESDSNPTSSAASSDAGVDEEREGGLRGFLRSMMGSSKARSKSQGPSRSSSRMSTASTSSTVTVRPGPVRSATSDTRMSTLSSFSTRGPQSSPETTRNSSLAPHIRKLSFKFSLEYHHKAHAPAPSRLYPPRLPMPAQLYLQSVLNEADSPLHVSRAVAPVGEARASAKYAGRALAEWMGVVMECQSFFERRKGEGIPSNKYVETPTLGIEVFARRAG